MSKAWCCCEEELGVVEKEWCSKYEELKEEEGV